MCRETRLARPASDLGISRGMMMMSKKNLSISFCLAFVSLIFIFFFTCPSLLVLPKTLPVQQI